MSNTNDTRAIASRILANQLPMLDAIEYNSATVGNVSGARHSAGSL